jgi:hypothetical protein
MNARRAFSRTPCLRRDDYGEIIDLGHQDSFELPSEVQDTGLDPDATLDDHAAHVEVPICILCNNSIHGFKCVRMHPCKIFFQCFYLQHVPVSHKILHDFNQNFLIANVQRLPAQIANACWKDIDTILAM